LDGLVEIDEWGREIKMKMEMMMMMTISLDDSYFIVPQGVVP